MAAPQGHPRYGGRTKGTQNKHPAEIKEMILHALEHKGGWRYLARQADENPVAFLGLLGKIMPLQINGSGNVLLIEQLCAVANSEWQKERARLAPVTIEGESIDVTPQAHDDGHNDGYVAEEPAKPAETAAVGRTPTPPSRVRKRKETREELLARMAQMRAARKPRDALGAASGEANRIKASE